MPQTSNPKGQPITLVEATDLHYLSKSLYDNGSQFQATMRSGDGKMVENSEEILNKLVQDTIQLKPAALILSGDITFNGEKISLQEVADKLQEVEKAGIPVVAIPGNHDIEYPFAFQYIGDNVKPVENIKTDDFEKIMADYGWNEAISKAPDSMSYVYPLADDAALMMLDANTSDHPGTISDKTLSWMEEELQLAQQQNIQMIAVSHQNILKQNQLMYQGFVISNNDEVASLLRKYGVTLALSGHSHLQHTASEDGLTDICTESLAVYPLQYGVVTIESDRKQFNYKNQTLGILQKESLDRFTTLNENQMKNQFEELKEDIPDDIKQEMSDFAIKINRLYFTGHFDEAGNYKDEAGWKDWEKYAPDSFFFSYMQSMAE